MKEKEYSPGLKWELLRQGDEQGFYAAFRLCYDDLYRLGLFLYRESELAKECIHLLFIELWKIRGRLKDVGNIKEYSITIYKRLLYKQKNGSLKHWSKIDSVDEQSVAAEMQTVSYEELLIIAQDDRFLQKRLQDVLQQLATRQKELIRMRYLEEKTIDEIAIATSLTPRTIYNTLHNALLKLRELLKG